MVDIGDLLPIFAFFALTVNLMRRWNVQGPIHPAVQGKQTKVRPRYSVA
jgi:hypothetical protein